ncbi:MAG: AAA family ATPase [Polyangiaceae bacterium]|nr:AAA family ATPase [Polyangiaceae bacterium]
MSTAITIDEAALPLELTAFDAVSLAYPTEIATASDQLLRGLPVLIECEKELVPYLFRAIRDRLKRDGRRTMYLDGRPPADWQGPPPPGGVVGMMIHQVREAVRGSAEERVVVLPHLDLLVASGGAGLTSEAREVIALVYENPTVVWLGFRDPSFAIPEVVTSLFPKRVSILGVPRDRLAHLVTRKEARKLGRGLSPYLLYKYVSGINAARLRRLLSTLEGEDYPSDASHALGQLRAATQSTEFELPDIDLERDIGGYDRVKTRLRKEILDLLIAKDGYDDPERIKIVESLVPRGMIFWGPPGTGKTLFAKAMATALGAAVTVVSGPELKSKWVGESEENLRRVFMRARQSAPSIIVFDEIDAFAAARGTFEGSGVEHSMVNQLLTEMDGFRSNELVFVVGTTNLPESLDPALLRPGRFEFQLEIPYPDALDRAAIFGVHDRRLSLGLTREALDYAVRRTDGVVEGGNTRYSGDHIQALCRALARRRIREVAIGPTEPMDVERALIEYVERPRLTTAEERVVATHEAGHAIVALHCPHAPPIERISIQGDIGGALGAVSFADPAHRYVVTQAQLEARMTTLFGGREAELLVFQDVSVGAEHDIAAATAIARSMVLELGMAEEAVGVVRSSEPRTGGSDRALSEATRARLDAAVLSILTAARERARRILEENRPVLSALTDLLIDKKVIDKAALAALGDRPNG